MVWSRSYIPNLRVVAAAALGAALLLALPATALEPRRLPEPAQSFQTLPAATHQRVLFSQQGDPQRAHLPMLDRPAVDAKTGATALKLDAEQLARIADLTDPDLLRRLGKSADANQPGPRLSALPRTATLEKALPWTADQLLANPTNMNDEYVQMAEDPDSGRLYVVFAATDLGGTDRDIHIADSSDGGAHWTVREMPSFSLDEYHPDIAIDGAGYIHVVWVRDDGTLMRARSAAPDNPAAWTNVYEFYVGEPLAIPSLAVSGAGDFARLFIAVNWSTINYDYYAYEWTILFLYSMNGGLSLAYDYFLPDGYEDLWPVVAMDGTTVHLLNAEVDLYTGQTEMLIATDAYNGGFASPASLSGWTENDCGFPDITCQGDEVFLVFQHDYSDGLTTDGDIIYCYSWDAGASFFGPVGMVADEYESVGPTILTRDGVVGCYWLDAPAGGDEFVLAGRLGAGHGHTDFMGGVETISDEALVEPAFRSAAGLAAPDVLHAVWIDRRDYATQGHNVYTSRRALTPNLAPFTPDGWGDALVASMIAGEREAGYLAADQPAYVSFALLNDGLGDATGTFEVQLLADGAIVGAWTVAGLATGTYVALEDYEITLPAGVHTLTLRIDPTGAVAEDDEQDNSLARTWNWITGDPEMRLNPGHLVFSIVPGTAKSALSGLTDDPPLRSESSPQRIGSALAGALDAAGPADLLRVMIVPAERLDPAACRQLLAGAAPATRKAALLGALQTQSDRAWQTLRPRLENLNGAGKAAAARPQPLAGVIAARLTPAAVEDLAADPLVGRLWLDDQLSVPFGQPAAVPATDPGPAKALAWHLPAIRADEAWAMGATGEGVLVGHLDTGIRYDHPDLAGRMWDGGAAWPHHGFDAVDEDGDPYDGDTSWWHGTHTAGLVAGDGSGGSSTGAAPAATLMALRSVPGYAEDLNEALQFGLDHDVDLFTYSGGWTAPSEELRAANRYTAEVLLAADVPWICAAGNGDNVGGHFAIPYDIASPADCPSAAYAPAGLPTAVLAVGALTSALTVWDGSSVGPTAWEQTTAWQPTLYDDYPYPSGLMKPDLAAPGDQVTSTTAGGYVAYSGTSMACPLVAGSAAILLGEAPWLTVEQLFQTLTSTATDITAAPATYGRDNHTGEGLVNLVAALNHLPSARSAPVWICNDGVLPLQISQAAPVGTWLDVEPPSMVAPGDSAQCRLLIDPTGLPEGFHQGSVIFLANDPQSVHVLDVTLVYGENLSAVDETPAALPAARLSNHPNPFNPRTVLRFETARTGAVRIGVFDLRGRRLRSLVDETLGAGAHEVVWDGRDDAGRDLASGQYFARLEVAGQPPATRKMTLLR